MSGQEYRQVPCGRRKSEEGVALLLTLGVLALLMVLAITFAFTARIDREAASVNTDITKAKMLAETAMDRALAYLSYTYKGDDLAANPGDIYPATSTAADNLFGTSATAGWTGHRFFVSQGTTDTAEIERAVGLDLGFEYTPASNPGGAATWQHIFDDSGNLIGRVAFLVIDESGKIEPAAVVNFHEPYVDANSSGSYNAGEVYYDWDGGNDYDAIAFTEGSEDRWGYDPSEIDIEYAYPAGITSTEVDPDFFRTRLPSWSSGATPIWFSWTHMLNGMLSIAPAVDGLDPVDAPDMCRVFFPHSYDIEAFWVDANANNTWDADNPATPAVNEQEDRHRFNLARSDWNSVAVSTLLATDADAYSGASTGGINWLRTLDADTIADDEARNQVAANIIDYSDNGILNPANPAEYRQVNETATSDYTRNRTASWGGSPPDDDREGNLPSATYVGLENVPYANEVALAVHWSEQNGAGTGAPYTLTINVTVELVNMYSFPWDGSTGQAAHVILDLDLSGINGIAGANPPSPSLALESASLEGATFRWNGVTIGSNDYATCSQSITYTDLTSVPTAFNADCYVSVLDDVVGMHAGDLLPEHLWDFGHTGLAVAAGSELDLSGIPADTWRYAHFATSDPRANTAPEHWDKNGFDSVDNSTDGLTNADSTNVDPESVTSGGGMDRETTTDQASGVSTAYIRNAPIKSLWELGAIHRGEPWKTLNIKAYNSGAAAATYANGDALILSQVKIGPQTVAYGKVNANSPIDYVWRGMLARITVGAASYDSPATGTELASTWSAGNDIYDIIYDASDGILATNGTTAGTAFLQRGQIAQVAMLSDTALLGTRTGVAAADVTDRMQEEIIGKIAHLLTVRQTFCRVIAVGQVVKDLGTAPDALPADARQTNWVEYDTAAGKWCSIDGEQKIMAIVYRDAVSGELTVVRMEYIED